jgi:hypothetical protein
MRAAALGIATLVLTGVAFATPVAVLRVDPGGRIYALDDGAHYRYSYQQSIYQVPVIEEHLRAGDTLQAVRVRSRDLRAVEYFRWDGQIRRDGDEFVQDAPPNHVTSLAIAVTREGAQRLQGNGFDLALRAEFGETVVRLTPMYVPRLLAIVGRR